MDCSAWCKQLRILLWKNCTLRRRHYCQTFCQLIFPTFVFALLVVIKKSDPSQRSPELGYCHFNELALPSTGVLPLAQNFRCARKPGTCHDTEFHPVFAYSNAFIRDFLCFVLPQQDPDDRCSQTTSSLGQDAYKEVLAEANALAQEFSNRTTSQDLWELIFAKRCPPPKTEKDDSGRAKHQQGIGSISFIHKVLFTPDNDATRAIMRNMNEPFETIDLIRNFDKIIDTSGILKQESNEVKAVLKTMLPIVAQFGNFEFEAVSNEIDLEKKFQDANGNGPAGYRPKVGAVVFLEMNDSQSILPPHVIFKIRLDSEEIGSKVNKLGRYREVAATRPRFGENPYISTGFVFLQDMVETGIIRAHLTAEKSFTMPQLTIQRMPSPCSFQDDSVYIALGMFPLLMTISFFCPVMTLVKRVVSEKERCLKETMKIMGMRTSAYWSSWFIESYLSWSLTLLLIVILLVAFGILAVNAPTMVLFLLPYIAATITLCFFLSTLFYRSSVASYVSALLFLLSHFLSAIKPNIAAKLLLCLVPNVPFATGCEIIAYYEGTGQGVRWSATAVDDQPLSLATYFGMLILDSIFYMCLTLYIEAVCPGEFGQGKSWCFCLTPRYTTKQQKPLQVKDSNIETEPENVPVGVSLQDVKKAYGDFVVVEGLNMNFFEGQITTLLGYNGAGKTTIISMVVGLIPPTGGAIYILGKDLSQNTAEAQALIGYCPQQNILFDELTVVEHLWYYSNLKSFNESIPSEMEKLLKETGLDVARNKLSENLSGGMKRKLSILIAFIGGTKIIVFDEPTAGVDPTSRRDISNMIYARKPLHTIIMSTHVMEEADIISDRIAIIDQGHLKCGGSPGFLKKRFGTGYNLTIAINSKEDITTAQQKILQFLAGYVPEVTLVKGSSSELQYLLPRRTDNYESVLAKMFLALEAQKDALFINSYGINAIDLEEVFLQATGKADSANLSTLAAERHAANSKKAVTHFAKIIFALEMKRLHYAKRNWLGVFCQIILPVVLVLFALAMLATLFQDAEEPSSLAINTWMFKESSESNELFFSQSFDKDTTSSLSSIETSFFSNISYGTGCTKSASYGAICTEDPPNLENFAWKNDMVLGKMSDYCSCKPGEYGCKDYDGIYPPSCLLPTNDVVYNLTMQNVSDFLLLTDESSFGHRFGGYELKNVAFQSPIDAKSTLDRAGNIKMWFNSKGSGSEAAYVNAINNVILRTVVAQEQGKNADLSSFGISVFNHPMKSKNASEEMEDTKRTDRFRNVASALQAALMVIFATSFIPASFIRFYVEEKRLKLKHLQYLSGVRPAAYWTAALLWDVPIFLITSSLIIAVFAAFKLQQFVSSDSLFPVIFLFFLYGWASTTLSFLTSFCCAKPTTAMVLTICFYSQIGSMTTFTAFFIEMFNPDTKNYFKVFLILPQYCFGRGILDLVGEDSLSGPGRLGRGGGLERSRMDWDFLGEKMFFLALHGIVYFILTLCVDYNVCSISACNKGENKAKHSVDQEDPEVAKERTRVLGSKVDDILVVKNLTKYYKYVPAVKGISFGIKQGECFGLVGMNGAGKTTTLKILTGDVSATSGSVHFMGQDILKNSMQISNKAGYQIGYCPQENALSPLLTTYENLQFYARVHGYAEADLPKVVNASIKCMALDKFVNVRTDTLSEGTKRKLATAIALLGNPSLMLLDEPSTGMDPLARKYLSKNIQECLQHNQSIVIVSHLMSECEAFCTRIAVMRNGEFLCLGSPQHLKDKYGSLHTLTMKLKQGAKDANTEIQAYMAQKLPEAAYVDGNNFQLKYTFKLSTLKLHKVFQLLEEFKSQSSSLEDYIITQVSLHQVFLDEMATPAVSGSGLPNPVSGSGQPNPLHDEPQSNGQASRLPHPNRRPQLQAVRRGKVRSNTPQSLVRAGGRSLQRQLPRVHAKRARHMRVLGAVVQPRLDRSGLHASASRKSPDTGSSQNRLSTDGASPIVMDPEHDAKRSSQQSEPRNQSANRTYPRVKTNYRIS